MEPKTQPTSPESIAVTPVSGTAENGGSASSQSGEPQPHDWPRLSHELLEWCITVVGAIRHTVTYLRSFNDAVTRHMALLSEVGTEATPVAPREAMIVAIECDRFHESLAKLETLFKSKDRIPSFWQDVIQVGPFFSHPIDYDLMVETCIYIALANHPQLRPLRFRGRSSITCAELVALNSETILNDLLHASLRGDYAGQNLPGPAEWKSTDGAALCRRFLREYARIEWRLNTLTETRLDRLVAQLRIEYVRTLAWSREPQVVMPADAGLILGYGSPAPPRITVDRKEKTITIGNQVHHLNSDELAVYLNVLWTEKDWMSDNDVNKKLEGTPDAGFAGTRWDLIVRNKLKAEFTDVASLLETNKSKGTRFKRDCR